MRLSQAIPTPTVPAPVLLWFYLRRELLILAYTTMETAVVTPIATLLMPWARLWSPTLLAIFFFGLILLPFQISRAMTLSGYDRSSQRRVISVALFVTILLAYRLLLYRDFAWYSPAWLLEPLRHMATPTSPLWIRDASLFVVICVAWWRGIVLVGSEPNYRQLGRRIRVTGLLLLPLIIALAGRRLPWSLVPFVLLFFLAALVAIALVRAEEIELRRSGSAFPLSPRWIAVVFVASLAVVTVSAGATALASDVFVSAAVAWLDPLWTAVSLALTGVTAVVLLLVAPAFELLVESLAALVQRFMLWLQAQGVDLDFSQVIQQPQPLDPGDVPAEPSAIEQIPIFAPRLVIGIIIFVLVVLSFNRIFRLLRNVAADRRLAAGADERADLPPVSLGQRLRRQWSRLQRWRAAASVRRVYRQMCETAAIYGYGRDEAETPYEYLATLREAWPDGQVETDLITGAYVRVRYGEVPESAAELAEIRAAFRRLMAHRPARHDG